MIEKPNGEISASFVAKNFKDIIDRAREVLPGKKKKKEEEERQRLIHEVIGRLVYVTLKQGFVVEHPEEKSRSVWLALKGKSVSIGVIVSIGEEELFGSRKGKVARNLSVDVGDLVENGKKRSFSFSVNIEGEEDGEVFLTPDWRGSYMLLMDEIDLDKLREPDCKRALTKRESKEFMEEIVGSEVNVPKTNKIYKESVKNQGTGSLVYWAREKDNGVSRLLR